MIKSHIRSYIDSIESKSIVFSISLLLFLSPILYFSGLNNPSHVPRIAFLSLIAVLVSFIYFYSLFKKKEIYFHKIHVLVLILLTWATISISWTIDYGNFAYEIIPLWSLVALFFITSQISSFNNIKIFISLSILGALYAATIGLMQNYDLNPVGYRFDYSIMNSTFGFKNFAALYMDLIAPVSLVMVLVTDNKMYRWFYTIAAAIIIGFLLELHTRGSWLVLFIWIAVFIIFTMSEYRSKYSVVPLLKLRKKELASITILSLLIFFSHGTIDEKWDRPVQEGQILDTSSGDRLKFYYNSISLIKDKPILGTGYGAFWKGFRPYNNKPFIIKRSSESLYIYQLHSDPLQYFVELGIPGGLLVCAIFIFVMYMGYKMLNVLSNPAEKLLVFGLFAGALACGLHSLIDFPLHKPSSAIQFWLFLGLLSGIYIKHTSHKIKINNLYVTIAITLTVIHTIAATTFHYKNITSNYYHRLAVISKLNGNCKEATQNIDKAVQTGGFYLMTHSVRVYMHTACKTRNDLLLQVINEELAWDNTNLTALLYRGQIMLDSGYPFTAHNDFYKVIQILPHRPTAKILLVKTLIELKKMKEAKKLLLKTQKEHPNNSEIKKLLLNL